jgi:hypothetical protein
MSILPYLILAVSILASVYLAIEAVLKHLRHRRLIGRIQRMLQ